MNSRERVRTALAHREPDHVPLDIGGSDVTGIHRDAYKALARCMGQREDVPICEIFQQVACPDEAFLRMLEVDVRPIFPSGPSAWSLDQQETDRHIRILDEWGVEWAMPKAGGLYFDMVGHPLSDCRAPADLRTRKWPDGADPGRSAGLRKYAERISAGTQSALIMLPSYGGIFESGFWLRGFQQFYEDLGSAPAMADAVLDVALSFRLDYWARVLQEVGDLIDVVVEYDDLGHGSGLLISPVMYRRFLKPRQKELFAFIKAHTRASMFLHSCGAIYDLIPDLIEVGVEILNPIQLSASSMGDTRRLKREFGKDLTFWGGGANSQTVLPNGSPQEVREEVKRRIEDLAHGGGFVFAAVHNIQPDVPPENILAMWKAWKDFGAHQTSGLDFALSV